MRLTLKNIGKYKYIIGIKVICVILLVYALLTVFNVLPLFIGTSIIEPIGHISCFPGPTYGTVIEMFVALVLTMFCSSVLVGNYYGFYTIKLFLLLGIFFFLSLFIYDYGAFNISDLLHNLESDVLQILTGALFCILASIVWNKTEVEQIFRS